MHPSMPIIGMADLQRSAKRILARVKRTKQPHLICNRNTPEALFMAIETYEHMERELQCLREERRIAGRVRKAEDDIAAGRTSRGDLAALLKKRR
ncbi:MAG: type II toxin-antitoxin system Phd/YefM family antitoxin [bacterium]|nr:type II toxin-antitoxin system Phd/YefM family antitoxin [bacterium]